MKAIEQRKSNVIDEVEDLLECLTEDERSVFARDLMVHIIETMKETHEERMGFCVCSILDYHNEYMYNRDILERKRGVVA